MKAGWRRKKQKSYDWILTICVAEPIPDLCQALVFSSTLFQYFKHCCEWAGYPRKQRATWRGKNKGGQDSDSEFVIIMYTYVKVG